MRRSHLYTFISIAAIVALVIGCANPGTPTGGPKDRKPPVLVKSIPEQNATNFNGSMVVLTFDENIQLKDQDTKFVMSPPLPIKPKLDAHGNVLRIRFDSDTILMPGTTYTLDFADCLSDLNENNVYENFTFTFSTGESQDSMMISGNLYDAQTITPLSGIYVLLQSNLEDSAFNKVPPTRIAKTDIEGRFAIKNVPAERKYRLYALDDQNRDFLYNQPGEQIAWIDEQITPSWEIRHINDSVRIDSLSTSKDTTEWVYEHILRDTLVYTPDSLKLFAFIEDVYDQYIASDNRKKQTVLSFTFNKPMAKKPRFSFPGQDPDVRHALPQYSENNDTVSVWLTDSLIYKGDSVVVAVTYSVLDSLKQMTDMVDTLTMWYIDKSASVKKDDKKSRKNKDNKEKKAEAPTLKMNIPTSVSVYGALSITSETPFDIFDWSKVTLEHKVDTLFYPVNFEEVVDTINICRKAIKAEWEPGEEYVIRIDSAAVRDIYGLQCNKKEAKVNVTKLDKYGTLYIVVNNAFENALLQLTDVKGEKVIRQNYVPSNGKMAFRYLKPSEYMIRIVADNNRNGKMDLGNYEKKIQPETQAYYMDKVAVRANWDIKVEFDVNDYDVDKFAHKFRLKKNAKKKK